MTTTSLYPDFSTIKSECGIVPREKEALQKDFRTLALYNPHIFGRETIADFHAWFEENRERFAAMDTLYLNCRYGIASLPIELMHYFPNIKKLGLEGVVESDEKIGEWKQLTSIYFGGVAQKLPASIGSLCHLEKVYFRDGVEVPDEVLYSKNDSLFNNERVSAYRHKDSLFQGICKSLHGVFMATIFITLFIFLISPFAPAIAMAIAFTALGMSIAGPVITLLAQKLYQLHVDSRPRLPLA